MVSINISLVGSNGDTINLSDSYSDYVLKTGVLGFGVPPVEVRISASASDGGVWRSTKRGIRDVDLPITILGSDRADLEDKLRRLANLVQDTNGPTKIVASYGDGTSFQIFAHYVGGADAAYGDDANGVMANWVLSFQAPQPFWESVTATNYVLQQTGGGRGLLPQLTKLKLAGQYGFGDVTLTNPGDVPAYPVWAIKGPCTSATFSSNGVGFTYSATILSTDTITIDTAAGTVKDQAGVNRYANLAAAPKLFPIQPGTQTVTVSAPGATSATQVLGNIKPRREVIH
ncbi:Siphovirus-type tail component [uncultured Caudovirales phage]|uniref:Siphovirus-type tail component n=1 Tax=uncultured Caudovirales phage TaxID=2100421 RepID=A0A6J5N541_9CAUD|nr:Siphovirus-type tail component [uncultured Caudovirales phage]